MKTMFGENQSGLAIAQRANLDIGAIDLTDVRLRRQAAWTKLERGRTGSLCSLEEAQ